MPHEEQSFESFAIPPKEHYVLGFAFAGFFSRVALQRKSHPDWQKGKLNGVGGQINQGESPEAAMRREFREEASLDVAENEWDKFCIIQTSRAIVHCFRVGLETAEFAKIVTPETSDEKIVILAAPSVIDADIIDDVRWLVPMATDDDAHRPYLVRYSNA